MALALLALWAAAPGATAQETPAASTSAVTARTEAGTPAVPVRFRGRTLFEVDSSIGTFSAQERAAAIEQHLLDLSRASPEILGRMRVVERDGRSDLYAGDTLVRVITDDDARGTGRTRRQLAADQQRIVAEVLSVEFRDRSAAALMRGAALAAVATAVFVGLMVLVLRLNRFTRRGVHRAAQKWKWTGGLAHLRLLTPANVAGLSRTLSAALAWTLALLLVYFYLEYVLSLFPWTRGLAADMVAAAKSAVTGVLSALVGYIPELLNIVVIVIVARLALRIMKRLFVDVSAGRLTLGGFYPEWAMPTYSLLRALVIAIAAVMVFPYLPGSGSDGFKGVSVFIGLLVSLGAASAIANVIAGIVITYMRPFRIGDRVKIADAVGDVTGKDLFVVRLRTIKNVDITVPNALVLANHIVNFSSSAAERGLVLHTTVTIGYDAPWQKVHALLEQAARSVEGIKGEPAPFVFQTSLDDSYVSYELNAHTDRPREMQALYSALHAAIQDAFNAAGIEIMSPHYSAVRDGSRMAVPDEYLPKDYEKPGLALFLRRGPGHTAK